MIHLVHSQNRHLYSLQLAEMHRQRKAEFIDRLGWKAPRIEGDGEYDQYDDADAAYLLAIADNGDLGASVRIRPTAKGALLLDHFPQLLADDLESYRTPRDFEATRYCAAPTCRGAAGFHLLSRLHVAALEHVQDRGGDRLLGFFDIKFMPHFRSLSGLTTQPVGFPQPYDEGMAIAFAILAGDTDVALARSRLRLHSRQLFEAPPTLDPAVDVIALADACEVLADASEDTSFINTRIRSTAIAIRDRQDPAAVLNALSSAKAA